jgi:hypothetical protein
LWDVYQLLEKHIALKKCLRVITGINNQASCRSLFSEFEILTVTSSYIFETLCFIIKNRIHTTQYSDVHSSNTMYKHNLYCNVDEKALLGNDLVKQQWKRSDRCYAMTQYTHVNNGGEDVFCVVGAVVISRV